MNIFVIPSWYPSEDYPINGIFTKEQTYKICELDSFINIGVSLWGQKSNQHLLWLKDHVINIKKIISADLAPSKKPILSNLIQYNTPTFTWTRKIYRGNLEGIIKANRANLEAFVKDFGPVDIIHAHVGYPAGFIAMKLAQELGLPYVLTEHMGPFPSYYDSDKQGRLKPFYKQAYVRAEANLAVSPSLASVMKGMGIPNVKVIPNFIDEHFFKPCSSLPHRHKNAFTFFTLSSITPAKGIDQLLYAIKKLGIATDINFNIGGDGSHNQEFKRLAVELGIADRIKWLGPLTREEALAAYQQCDAFVLPSLHESMGVVYIEALACGKPVIATKCGGPETIVKDYNGILIEKNDMTALADALQYMIDNARKYDADIIRQDFLNRFSSRAVVPQVLDLYNETIKNKKPNSENSPHRSR